MEILDYRIPLNGGSFSLRVTSCIASYIQDEACIIQLLPTIKSALCKQSLKMKAKRL